MLRRKVKAPMQRVRRLYNGVDLMRAERGDHAGRAA
jgi:hypothetical protein